MAWTNYQKFLAFMMLVTGSINTLSTKWADNSVSQGEDGEVRKFDHPFFQAVGMFMGELMCLLVFRIMLIHHRRRGQPLDVGTQQFSPIIFLPAALCDMCATSIMYVGLNLTFASSFQMLRGAVIIFTALLSVAFLGRHIRAHMWLGMLIVMCGLILVGASDIAFNNSTPINRDKNSIISGDLLIIMAQVVAACQMVYEERVVSRYNVPPLQAVGWEGFFGFTILGLAMIPMYFIKVGAPFTNAADGRLENVLDAFAQMRNNWHIILATIGNILSIAFFNFSGISVTKEMSATTRMVLDSCRTLVIWVVSLAVSWQVFAYKSFLVQAAGFVFLILGMCLYNNILFTPCLQRAGCLEPYEPEFEPRLDPNLAGTAIQNPDERTPLMINSGAASSNDPVYS